MSNGVKVSIIGAGNVGSTLAYKILEENLANVVLLDINGDLAKAKALDLEDACSLLETKKSILGTDNYRDIKESFIVVVTAGFARNPGMTREDLLIKNANVVKEVVTNIKKHVPDCIILMVTNPLDVMTYLALRVSGFDKRRVLGMAGVLDTGRLSVILSKLLNKETSSISSLVLGTHGDSMVPIRSKISVDGQSLSRFLKDEEIEEAFKKAKSQGGKIVSLLKGGSAYYAPSLSIFKMLEAIINNRNIILPSSVYLDGEYNLKDVCLGVPVRLGKNGVEEIIKIDLNPDEQSALQKASRVIKFNIPKIID